MTILYILLFLVCLSTLIMVHEAGHLVTAKIFKVYCFEYALGFGPRLFSFKRKKGETRFSIRAIPFGGFVSMYGEADSVPAEFEGVEIDKSRSINNIKHWKRAIVMTAGIIMNFVLAFLVFFLYEIAFPAYTPRIGHITIKNDSIAYEAGLRSEDYVYGAKLYDQSNNLYVIYDTHGLMTFAGSTESAYVGYSYSSMTIKNTNIDNKAVAFERVDAGEITLPSTSLTYQEYFNKEYTEETVDYSIGGYCYYAGRDSNYRLYFVIIENFTDTDQYGIPLEGKFIYTSIQSSKEEFENKLRYIPDGEYLNIVGNVVTETIGSSTEPLTFIKSKEYETGYANVNRNMIKETNLSPQSLTFDVTVLPETEDTSRVGPHSLSVNISNGKLVGTTAEPNKPLGIAMQLDERYNSYGTAVKNTFKDFGNSTTLIFRGLGQLFTPEGFKNVGGIIAIGVVTTQTLEQNGFGNFLFMWAMISVNLGIVNLLPFPGLDGWQFLVTIVEGVAHKEIPPKVKNTVSAIGIMLLFALMIMIVIKDIIMVV